MSTLLSRLLVFTSFVSVFTVGALAEAKPISRAAIRPGTKPMTFQLGMGPAFRITDTPTAFKLSQEINWHFSGNSQGAAIGAIVEQGFGNWGMFEFTMAPKFVYDIQVKPQYGFYISPSASLGYRLEHWSNGNNWHFLDMQFGVAAKLLFKDRWMLWLQPTNINMNVGEYGFGARYEFLFGGGVTF